MEYIIIMFLLIIIVFMYYICKIFNRLNFFVGAMESHSDLMLKIEAKRGINSKPINVVWFDPTVKHNLNNSKLDGKEVELDTIYAYLPLELRKNKTKK